MAATIDRDSSSDRLMRKAPNESVAVLLHLLKYRLNVGLHLRLILKMFRSPLTAIQEYCQAAFF